MKAPKKLAPRPHEVPAVLATQVNLSITDHGWRLTFGEPVDEHDVNYHTGVFLPTTIAHQLVDLMNSSMQKQRN